MACCGSRPPPLPAGASALRVDGAPGAPKRETSFKVVVMGDKGIGKSAVVCRFTRGSFADGMATTIGAAFAMKDVPIDDGVARLQIWGASSSGRRARRSIRSRAVRVRFVCCAAAHPRPHVHAPGRAALRTRTPVFGRADTAGEELYRAMTRNFFREAAVGIIVYDVTSQTSFASTTQWLADFAVRRGAARGARVRAARERGQGRQAPANPPPPAPSCL
jgi:GTPase SAR1 family protein